MLTFLRAHALPRHLSSLCTAHSRTPRRASFPRPGSARDASASRHRSGSAGVGRASCSSSSAAGDSQDLLVSANLQTRWEEHFISCHPLRSEARLTRLSLIGSRRSAPFVTGDSGCQPWEQETAAGERVGEPFRPAKGATSWSDVSKKFFVVLFRTKPPFNIKKISKARIGIHLAQVFLGKGGSEDGLARYLQQDVGLSKKAHADAIAEYVKRTVARDAPRTAGAPRGRQITLCVEGNISAGKSTFLADIIEGSDTLKV